MFDKVLIANRGEIAVRINRACQELGISTVAVHSEADRESMHVRIADESVCVGPNPVSKSYLNAHSIISACEISGSHSVLPGYGFFSEYARFAKTLQDHNLSFIGPSYKHIEMMGDKIQAKKIMTEYGVPTVPGSEDIVKDENHAIKISNDIGFPVLLKASAGGGGRGMKVVHNENELKKDQTDSAKMFQMGIEGGKPREGNTGVAPEWFYKGNGTNLKGPNEELEMPDFSLDGGEEPEIIGCYIIDFQGNPVRIGFSLGNEFSDHETEQINYLYLAHSKMRNCSIGPELDTRLEFKDISISCEIDRDGSKIYESGILKSGEEYMSHSLDNMEYHHFKYDIHRRPGAVSYTHLTLPTNREV